MIFCSKNECGVPAWGLVLNGTKTVTRRLKPVEVGKVRAVQPGRTKKAMGYIRITSCVTHKSWVRDLHDNNKINDCFRLLDLEANREGFKTWLKLLCWFDDHKVNIEDTYRIGFTLMDKV